MPEKKIPSNPRWTYAKTKARELLSILGYTSFPIDPFKVLDDLPAEYRVKCLSWTEMNEKMNIPDPFHLRKQNADARTILTTFGNYQIVYKDNVPYPDRIPFTIAHEIGHIFMNHLTDFGLSGVLRGGLTDETYHVLESEADYFAAEFLMPTCLINTYCHNLSPSEIKIIFGVSRTAASVRYDITQAHYADYECVPYDAILKRNFYKFFKFHFYEAYFTQYYKKVSLWNLPPREPSYNKCKNCYTISRDGADFCTYCGTRITEEEPEEKEIPDYKSLKDVIDEGKSRVSFFSSGGIQHRNLPTIEIKHGESSVSRLYICPTCLNHQIDKDDFYCGVCGTALYNVCYGCRNLLPYDSSYCPQCGLKAPLHDTYELYEKRNGRLEEESKKLCQLGDYIEYPYWDYIKGKFRDNIGGLGAELFSALFYSKAYIDDDDNLLILCIDSRAEGVIERHKSILKATLESSRMHAEVIKVRCINAL